MSHHMHPLYDPDPDILILFPKPDNLEHTVESLS